MQDSPLATRRRSLLQLAGLVTVSAVAGSNLAGCVAGTSGQTTASPAPRGSATSSGRPRVLLAYFSRAGWNYHYGGRTHLRTGNTEVLAVMISRLIECDVHRIEAAEPYSDDYQDTVERNVREQSTDARPVIADPLASIDQYEIVLLASGIWNVRAPMIMSRFADSYDFAGKTVHPVTTHAMSGLGTTERDYAATCRGAVIADGLAVRGEEVNDARPAVETWLRQNGLLNP
ncbi:flavodoxin [Micromonospora peucetia]|uniref:Flavodoxin n=1 Tax=Micromonospora peucetia TaxID=47871 RepID=A0A1C6VVG4_9ACTN|nr:flavodoxin [Micromonospora peucetia]SCL70348.1 Flavodoxin [Micromonospora peucetia]